MTDSFKDAEGNEVHAGDTVEFLKGGNPTGRQGVVRKALSVGATFGEGNAPVVLASRMRLIAKKPQKWPTPPFSKEDKTR